jgi:hypothetical protein
MRNSPLPDFTLRGWSPKEFVAYRKATETLAPICNGEIGSTSKAFEEACEQIKDHVGTHGKESLASCIQTPIAVRAVAHLLATDIEFPESVVVEESLFPALLRIKSPISKLALIQLIRAYFMHFDDIASAKGLNAWEELIIDPAR